MEEQVRASAKEGIRAKSIAACLWALATVLCLAGAAGTAVAQDQGRISGTIQDESKSSVPNATVTVTNGRTGEVRTTTTKDDGAYSVLALRPSVYTIHVTAAQFAAADATNVQVTIGLEIHRDF